MKLLVISSSLRMGSNSRRFAEFLKTKTEELGQWEKADVIDTVEEKITSWVACRFDSSNPKPSNSLDQVIAKIAEADAFIFVIPEWEGMACPGVKNISLLCSNYEMAHKPILLCSISTGTPKATPLCEMRMSGFKNGRLLYIPDQLLIGHVVQYLDDPSFPFKKDLDERISYNLKVLSVYASHLQGLKDSPIFDYKKFPFGM